jgi:drug/metabolite transporter (DMT)-like permease
LDTWINEADIGLVSAYLPLVAVIVSGVVYHCAQKTAGAAHPWPILSVAYGAAFAVTTALALASGPAPGLGLARSTALTGVLIGLAAFGIEAGYFFVYRSGWPLSSASIVASLSITLVLALFGVLRFGEELSAARAVGLGLAAIGLVLIAWD